MKFTKFVSMSAFTIIMLIGISIGTTNALESEDWAGKWFKIRVNFKATCDDLTDTNQDLQNDSVKEVSWIHFDPEYDGGDEIASSLIINDNGVWQAVPVTLIRVLGSANHFILESEYVDVDESEDIIEVYFVIKVMAKEKREALSGAKIKSVAGTLYVFESNENECYGDLKLIGKLVKENKVPQEVKDSNN